MSLGSSIASTPSSQAPTSSCTQTAEILQGTWGRPPVTWTDALSPDAPPEALNAWLAELTPPYEHLLIVGHRPQLGLWLGSMLAGAPVEFAEVKKGSAILLRVSDELRPGRVTLEWSLRPKHLRMLGA